MGWATFNGSGYHVSDGENGAWLFFDDLQFGSLLEASKAHFSNPGQKKNRKRRAVLNQEVQADVRGRSSIKMLPGLLPRQEETINQTLDRILENPLCKAAFKANFGVTPGELIGKGLVFGPATLLSDAVNTRMIGITDDARQVVIDKGGVIGSLAIQAFTIKDWPGFVNDTVDGMPRVFLNASAFSGGTYTLQEVLVHELLHVAGWPPNDGFSSWVYKTDLSHYDNYKKIMDACK